MIVHHTGSLHVRIDDRGADKFKSARFQVFGQRVRFWSNSEDYAWFKEDDKFGLVDRTGLIVFPAVIDSIGFLSDLKKFVMGRLRQGVRFNKFGRPNPNRTAL